MAVIYSGLFTVLEDDAIRFLQGKRGITNFCDKLRYAEQRRMTNMRKSRLRLTRASFSHLC